ncbi:MAG: T9SS type A sorting domain-containing protein [Paludibacteraceae bacterium]|nr:T9SS type A sorting domain-containing protein [Paludibacteraceae bacterium]
MKKKSLLVLAAMGVWGSVFAEPSFVTIEFKDLTKKSFLLADAPVFQFKNDSLVVNGDASTAYQFEKVAKYYFADAGEGSNIPTVATNEVRVTYLDNQHIQVEGLAANSQVGLFSVLGQVIEQKSAKEGKAVLFTLPAAKGVYILKVNEQSIKIIKK